jgi:hypothetical protein
MGIKQKYRLAVFLFFIAYLLIGIAVYKDYGVHWDGPKEFKRGILSWLYIKHGSPELFEWDGRFHGPAFELLLLPAERILCPSGDTRRLYQVRHACTFGLFYVSVFIFYLLAKRRFNSWKMGLVGAIFLIASPQIFANSFYNAKDIPFLSLFIISIYTLLNYLERKTVSAAVIHAVACALLIDVRIGGILVPVLTAFFLAKEIWSMVKRPDERMRLRQDSVPVLVSFGLFWAVLVVVTIGFWPFLWPHPLLHFKQALTVMSAYPFTGSNFYLGNYVESSHLPWHYVPFNLLVTTPLAYSLLFSIGFYSLGRSFVVRAGPPELRRPDDLLYLAWFSLPLAYVFVRQPVLYNSWRHMFFIYPAFIMIALVGFSACQRGVALIGRKRIRSFVRTIFYAGIIGNVGLAIIFMVRNHPYQHVYFNRLAGANMEEVKKRFELDYWGLSFGSALEYVMKNDPRTKIKICAPPRAFLMLQERDRGRAVMVTTPEEADYILSNYRRSANVFIGKQEYYSIKVGGTNILVVYKMK